MGYQSARMGYTIRVDGLLLAGTRFVIQAAVEYAPNLSEAERESLVPRAQLELLLAIEGEEDRARRLGAKTVHVGVVGDEQLYRAFRTRSQVPPPRAERPPRSAVVRRIAAGSPSSRRALHPANVGA